jgi:hypothetical protein
MNTVGKRGTAPRGRSGAAADLQLTQPGYQELAAVMAPAAEGVVRYAFRTQRCQSDPIDAKVLEVQGAPGGAVVVAASATRFQ